MIELVDVKLGPTLDDYGLEIELSGAVQQLRDHAARLAGALAGRRVWMINSAARGGGVAEMLPRLVTLLRQVGVDTSWAVIVPEDPAFFTLTKRIHNLLHGSGDPHLGPADRARYDATSARLAAAMKPHLRPSDLVVVHDPQPAGLGALLKEELGVACIWRCHIGLDADLPQTRAGWGFLRPYVEIYDHAVFSVPEYVPAFLADRAALIPPAIDPFSHKNRRLEATKLTGVLCNSGLLSAHHPVVAPPFEHQARRLKPDGTFALADHRDGIGLLFRPVISQISRWDRLKGFAPLLEAFVAMKRDLERLAKGARERRRLALVRLVLAGPDAGAVKDDPEAEDVLAELCRRYAALDRALQDDVAILQLPMHAPKDNALMVNAIQRCSSVVVQNSLREGFGLTVTEAMWKSLAVLGSSACGIRHQIDDRVHGRRIEDPEDVKEVATALAEMLNDPYCREHWGARARRRVYDEFLVFTQARRWLDVLAAAVQGGAVALPL